MESRDVWFNLPVKDVKGSRSFYEGIGFRLNEEHGNSDQSASFLIGQHSIVLMLFCEEAFNGFINGEVSDARAGNEVLFSLSAESKDEVDDMVQTVKKAGGSIFAEPEEIDGWMYSTGFSDPDGHKWNVLYVDMSKMPAGEGA
jgi:predicted lactoylglutathione lyase